MTSPKVDYVAYATLNRKALAQSSEAACVHCLRRYRPDQIVEWRSDLDRETGQSRTDTAVCPMCGSDAVVPSALCPYSDENFYVWHRQAWGSTSLLDALSKLD